MGRPLAPVFGRMRNGRPSRVICVATNLAPSEVELLDLLAARSGKCRSEFIRDAVLEKMTK